MARHYILFILVLFISCKNVEIKKSDLIHEKSEEINIKEEKEEIRAGWKSFSDNGNYYLDIRYATENNFVNEILYDCGKCFLRSEAGDALEKVAVSLSQFGFKLVLFDCYRPKPIQQKLWDKVPNPNYVTPPKKGSMHNRGLAVDLTIMNGKGQYLDMGTEYDYFGEEAHTDYFQHSNEVLKNRKLLSDLMEKYGFKGIRTEWWHFSFVDASYEIADWEWDCP